MQAILHDAPGDPDVLYLGEAPTPVPSDGDLLVRVEATALNRADLMQRAGNYPPPKGVTDILGLEIAGVVQATEGDCGDWKQGDRVCGIVSGGGYAEVAVLPHGQAMRVPPRLSSWEAAAVPEVFLTAFQALVELGGIDTAGADVLVHAGASGVGTAAIQLIRELGGRAFVTASAPKHDTCLTLGAVLAVDYKAEDFAERVLEATDGRGVNLVVDVIGAPYLEGNLRVLQTDGRIVMLAMLGGRIAERLDLGLLFRRRGTLLASTLRSRTPAYKAALTQHFADRFRPLLEDGRVVPVIDSVYDWTDVREAHRHMEANANIGKIVLRLV